MNFNADLYATNATSERLPHYEQGRQWTRYARRIRLTQAAAIREDALAFSKGVKSKGLCFPIAIQADALSLPAAKALTRQSRDGHRFLPATVREQLRGGAVEMEARIDVPGGTARLGLVPASQARWIRPLLARGFELTAFVLLGYDWKPVNEERKARAQALRTRIEALKESGKDTSRLEAALQSTAEAIRETEGEDTLTVVVCRPDQAARVWQDLVDDWQAARALRREENRSASKGRAYVQTQKDPYAGADTYAAAAKAEKAARAVSAEIARREARIEKMQDSYESRAAKRLPNDKLGEAICALTEANRKSADYLNDFLLPVARAERRDAERRAAEQIDVTSVEDWLREDATLRPLDVLADRDGPAIARRVERVQALCAIYDECEREESENEVPMSSLSGSERWKAMNYAS